MGALSYNRLLLLLFLSLANTLHLQAATTSLHCSDTVVTFTYIDQSDLKCLCSTTAAALGFLESLDLKPANNITINLTTEVPAGQEHHHFGTYDFKKQDVNILSYPEVMAKPAETRKVFGLNLDEELWCSIAAHELAHVVIRSSMNHQLRTHTADEYLAYVTQLQGLTPSTRAKIRERFPEVTAYRSTDEMSETYFLLAPNKFALKSYLHFITLEQPKKFIHQMIIEGKLLE